MFQTGFLLHLALVEMKTPLLRVYIQTFAKETGGVRGCVVYVADNNVTQSYYPKRGKQIDDARQGIQLAYSAEE